MLMPLLNIGRLRRRVTAITVMAATSNLPSSQSMELIASWRHGHIMLPFATRGLHLGYLGV